MAIPADGGEKKKKENIKARPEIHEELDSDIGPEEGKISPRRMLVEERRRLSVPLPV